MSGIHVRQAALARHGGSRLDGRCGHVIAVVGPTHSAREANRPTLAAVKT